MSERSYAAEGHAHARAWKCPPRRILLVTPQPFYEDRGTPIAVANTCRALSELGYWIDVLAFPIGRPLEIAGVKIYRCPNPLRISGVPIGFSASKCVLDASLLGTFEHLLRTNSYDVVHAVEEAAYIASVLCGRTGIPFIYDMASSIPHELRKHKVLGRPIAQRMLNRMERVVLKRASHVVCSIGLADHVRNAAPDTPFTEWRFPAIERTVDTHRAHELRSLLGIEPDDQVVMYSGNFARYQGVDLLLDAFSRALDANPSLLLVCVGASDEARKSALSRLDSHVKSRVRILTRQPRDTMPEFFAIADCLITLRPDSKNLPLKVFDYMVAGKPIVATKGPAHEPLLNNERAFLCDGHAESVTQTILSVFRSPGRAQNVAHSARLHAQRNYGWNRFVQLVDDIYLNVPPRPRSAALST